MIPPNSLSPILAGQHPGFIKTNQMESLLDVWGWMGMQIINELENLCWSELRFCFSSKHQVQLTEPHENDEYDNTYGKNYTSAYPLNGQNGFPHQPHLQRGNVSMQISMNQSSIKVVPLLLLISFTFGRGVHGAFTQSWIHTNSNLKILSTVSITHK